MIINLTQKELEEEFRKQFTSLGENNEKYITFTVLIEKEGTRIDANREEIRKEQLAYYNLLIVPDLWQVHYQILLTIFLKEFIELHVNLDTMIKNINHVELNISVVTFFSNIETLMMM